MLVTLSGMVTLVPFPVYFVSTPSEEIDKPGSTWTGSKFAGAGVTESSAHLIFPVSDTKAVICSELIVTVIVTEAACNTIVPSIVDVTLPLVIFISPP